MIKVNETVRRETVYIAAVVLILSVLMEAVFLILRRWDYTVLLGNLLSAAVAVANFFLMGLTVQKAVEKDEKDAANAMKLSQRLRLLMIFAVLAMGVSLGCFNIIAVLIPQFFPRIAVALRPLFNKTEDGGGEE